MKQFIWFANEWEYIKKLSKWKRFQTERYKQKQQNEILIRLRLRAGRQTMARRKWDRKIDNSIQLNGDSDGDQSQELSRTKMAFIWCLYDCISHATLPNSICAARNAAKIVQFQFPPISFRFVFHQPKKQETWNLKYIHVAISCIICYAQDFNIINHNLIFMRILVTFMDNGRLIWLLARRNDEAKRLRNYKLEMLFSKILTHPMDVERLYWSLGSPSIYASAR